MNRYRMHFGRRTNPEQPTAPLRSTVFGKRGGWAESSATHKSNSPGQVADFRSVAKARMTAICSDLVNLYADPAYPRDEFAFRLVEMPEFKLLIGHHASIRIDETRGLYVLSIEGRKPGTVTIETASDDLLLDCIICHLALDRGRHVSVTTYGLVGELVGNTLEDVERSLILATLRQHHFNRTRTAEVLGISLRTIRNKLKSYREGGAVDVAANAEIVCLPRSPPGG